MRGLGAIPISTPTPWGSRGGWSHLPPSYPLQRQATAFPPGPSSSALSPQLFLCGLGHQPPHHREAGSRALREAEEEPPGRTVPRSLPIHPSCPGGCNAPCLLPGASSQPASWVTAPSVPPSLSWSAELWSRMISCNWPAIRPPGLFYRHAG